VIPGRTPIFRALIAQQFAESLHLAPAAVSEDAGAVGEVVPALRGIPAVVRFISAEPLLEPMGDIKLAGFHWLIAGASPQACLGVNPGLIYELPVSRELALPMSRIQGI
jgi:protein gp37